MSDPEHDAGQVADAWLVELESAFERRDAGAVADLFVEDGWWRDFLALGWDLRLAHGREDIRDLIASASRDHRPYRLRAEPGTCTAVATPSSELAQVLAFLAFETPIAYGRGVVRLVCGDDTWRAWTLLTTMRELKGHEEPLGARRPVGANHGDGLTLEI